MGQKYSKFLHLILFLGFVLWSFNEAYSQSEQVNTFTEKSLYAYLKSQLQVLILGATPETEKLLNQAHKEDPQSWYIRYSIAENHILNGAFIKAKSELETLRKKHPKNIDVRLLLAKVYALLNYFDEALAIYKEIVALNPKHEESLFHLSLIYAAKRQYKSALKTLKKLEVFSDRLGLIYLYQARIYLEELKENQAIVALRKAIDSKTEQPEVYLLLAALLESKGERKEALSYYEEYSQINPDDQEVLKKLIDEYIADNNYEKALPMLHELHRSDPSNHKVTLKIALIGIEYSRLDEARGMLKHILKLSPEMDIAQYYLGMVCQIQEDDSCSQKAYGKVHQASPFFTDAILQRAFIFIGLRKYDRAIEELSKTRKKGLIDENITLVTSAAYELKGDLKPATKVLNEFLEVEKNNIRILYAKANILYKRKKFKTSIRVVKQLLQVDPNHVQGLNFLGYHLLTREDSPQSAYAPLKKAFDLAPGDPYILDSWGWYWHVMNDLEKAVQYLENAYVLKKDDVTILEHLVLALLKKGDAKKAQSFLNSGKTYYVIFTREEQDKFDGLQKKVKLEQRSLATE